MCIVCGPGGSRLVQSIAGQYGLATARSHSRFVAEEIAPAITPSLDPADLEDLKGPADVILCGGPILTLRSRGDVAPAIAVRAGRIQGVGDEESVLALRGRLTRMIDLDGRALLPGFVVADWHPPLSILCDWLEARETPALTLTAAIAERSGEWLALMIEGSAEDRMKAAIVATASRPAVIVDRTGSVLAASASAQALAPELDPAWLDAASTQARPHVSALLPTLLGRLAGSRDPLRARLSSLFREAARSGVTTLRFCGLGTLAGHDDPDLVRSAAGELSPLRFRGAVDAGLALHSDLARLSPGFGDDMFRIDTATHWIEATSADARELAEMVRALRQRCWRVTLHAESLSRDRLCAGRLLRGYTLRGVIGCFGRHRAPRRPARGNLGADPARWCLRRPPAGRSRRLGEWLARSWRAAGCSRLPDMRRHGWRARAVEGPRGNGGKRIRKRERGGSAAKRDDRRCGALRGACDPRLVRGGQMRRFRLS